MALSVTSKKRIAVAAVGAGVNLMLFFIKLYIGLSANSIAIYADSLNSLADSAVCIAAILGFLLLSSKVSKKYPFGTGKAEELLDLLISAVILFTGCAFAYISFERLLYPVPIWFSALYAIIIASTAAVKLGLVFFFKTISKKLGTNSINGIATDSLLDFFITLCTLISFTLTPCIGYSLDGIAGIIISIILIIQGIKMTVAACGSLIGKRDGKTCEKARKILESHSEIESVLDIQCHSYGETKIFTACIKVNCQTAEQITLLTQQLKDEAADSMNSQIYLSFGG